MSESEPSNEADGASAKATSADKFAAQLGNHMLEFACQFVGDDTPCQIPLVIAISVYDALKEDGYGIRYDFPGGGRSELERLHTVVCLLRECHQVAIEQLRIMELAAIPFAIDITGFN
jgi:hypothetical protein